MQMQECIKKFPGKEIFLWNIIVGLFNGTFFCKLSVLMLKWKFWHKYFHGTYNRLK